jgi:uncharacterized Rossmann fold enzyme
MLRTDRDDYFKDFYKSKGHKLLNLDPSRDRIAVQFVYSLIDCGKVNGTWFRLKQIASLLKSAIIIGPEMKDIEKVQAFPLEGSVIIGVDGASYAFFLKTGRMPDITVTDLDGPMRLYYLLREMNRYIVLHPHGDNIYRIANLYSILSYDNMIVTSQTENFDCIRNIGGFTDGDRAILLAIELGFKEIKVCCFSREPVYSHKEIGFPRDYELKNVKLRILYDLIQKIKESYGDRVKFIS